MTDKLDLLSCPFCAGEAELERNYESLVESYSARCKECDATTDFYGSREKAHSAWNRRSVEAKWVRDPPTESGLYVMKCYGKQYRNNKPSVVDVLITSAGVLWRYDKESCWCRLEDCGFMEPIGWLRISDPLPPKKASKQKTKRTAKKVKAK